MAIASSSPVALPVDRRALSPLQRAVFILCFLIVAVDGFDTTVIGFVAPAIMKEWAIPPAAFGRVFGIGLVGAMAGAFLFGPIADRIGRKTALVIATALFAGVCILSAWSQSVEQLILARFISGIGLGGALPCATALTSEFSPKARQGFVVTAMFCGFSLGAAIAGLLAAIAVPAFGWRAVIAIGGIVPLLLAPLLWWLLPESPRFLRASGRKRLAADGDLHRLGRDVAIDIGAELGTIQPRPIRLGDVFRERPVPGTMLIWCVSYLILLVMGLLSSWLPTLLAERGYPISISSLATLTFYIATIIGGVGIGWLMDKFRANRVLAASFALGGLCVAAIAASIPWITLVALTVFATGLLVSGGQAGIWAYVAAYYPTNVRATGVSWNSVFGRAGSMSGGFLGGGLLAFGFDTAQIFELLALPTMLAGAFMLLHERFRGDSGQPDADGSLERR